VRDWRGGGVGELREAKAELARVSARAEELQRGGSTAGLSSPGLRMDGGCVLGSGSGETAKERGERFAGVLVVLVRATGESGRLYPVLSTAAARWRPAGGSGRVARRGEGTARGKSGGGSLGATRGAASRQEVAPWPFHSGGGSAAVCRRRGVEEAGRQAGGRGIWTDLQFQKFQGLYCKAAITFNLGLK